VRGVRGAGEPGIVRRADGRDGGRARGGCGGIERGTVGAGEVAEGVGGPEDGADLQSRGGVVRGRTKLVSWKERDQACVV
jgi:hypothetical protein